MTPKQERFCEEYLVDLNATQAAIRAGYSEDSARITASKMLTNTNIQDRIAGLQKERSERTQVTVDRVLKELSFVGFSNIQDYIKSSGNDFVVFKKVDEIPEEAARAIESIKMNVKEGKVEFKLYSKGKALEDMGRHLGMFKDKDPLPVDVTFKIVYDKEAKDK